MIPTKARSTQMNTELLEHCKKEIQTLRDRKLIRPSKSPWRCTASYVRQCSRKGTRYSSPCYQLQTFKQIFAMDWLSYTQQKRFA